MPLSVGFADGVGTTSVGSDIGINSGAATVALGIGGGKTSGGYGVLGYVAVTCGGEASTLEPYGGRRSGWSARIFVDLVRSRTTTMVQRKCRSNFIFVAVFYC